VPPTVAGFRGALDTAFEVHVDATDAADAVEMTLVAVDEREAPSGWESFSLLFAGPDEPIPQATYPVRHPELGSFPLFVVPVAGDGGGPCFQAVFNRPSA